MFGRVRGRVHLGFHADALVSQRNVRREGEPPSRDREIGLPHLFLRVARPKDLARVIEIEQRSFSHPWSLETFHSETKQGYSRLLLAWTDGDRTSELVGYVCRWIVEREVQILNVAIHPDWRRRGIGRWIIEEVLAEARRNGATRATLEVRRHNLPAIVLYESLGFHRVGTRPNYYAPGEDALLMDKSLIDADG